MGYLRLTYRLLPEREDALVADLWLEGTLGVSSETGEDGLLTLTAYFPAGAAPPALAIAPVAADQIEETDWLAEYRRRALPFAVGRTLFVDPGEPRIEPGTEQPAPPPDGRSLLRIPARTAFGTGSHESTALAVELLEALEVRDRAVLDVGTGTGILCFAALLLGAARAVGFDCDLAAAAAARANGRLNRLAPLVFAGRLGAIDLGARRVPARALQLGARVPARASKPGARFDLVLANVVPEQILPDLSALPRVLRPGGTAILSGILAAQAPELLDQTRALGFGERQRRQRGEWVALALTLEPAPAPAVRP
ncbi:MAG TPA: 50S ribosomal protein L11 methyltransferase [Thermoanaerobaculia bacterium]|nr:50S ribosomal protein L11 methyltransferase [Thermoanaerobaculia bacterium]